MPVSPGNSRIIFISPRNFGVWIDKIVARWMYHIGQNLIIDSDLYLLHVEVKQNKTLIYNELINGSMLLYIDFYLFLIMKCVGKESDGSWIF